MVVANTSEFRVHQKKYLDLVKQDTPVFLKRGNDLFSITSVAEQQRANVNPVWAAHIEKAKQEIRTGKVTAIKSDDVWKAVRSMNTP